MIKIVTNRCFGGYNLSPLAVYEYAKACGKECYTYKQTKFKYKDGVDEYTKIKITPDMEEWYVVNVSKDFGDVTNDHKGLWDNYLTNSPKERDDTRLIEVIERLGEDANGMCANLQITEIPDDVDWIIDEYDGYETVEEKHNSW